MESRQEFLDHPVPVIDPALCDGCMMCVQVCPERALEVIEGIATVIRPDACAYHGFCERVCPKSALSRVFQIMFKPEEEK